MQYIYKLCLDVVHSDRNFRAGHIFPNFKKNTQLRLIPRILKLMFIPGTYFLPKLMHSATKSKKSIIQYFICFCKHISMLWYEIAKIVLLKCSLCISLCMLAFSASRFRLHTGETPYQCSYCQKKFTRKEHLTNHTR